MRARKTAKSPDCVPDDGQRPYLIVVVVGKKDLAVPHLFIERA